MFTEPKIRKVGPRVQSKAKHRARLNGPESEFIVMVRAIDDRERRRLADLELARRARLAS